MFDHLTDGGRMIPQGQDAKSRAIGEYLASEIRRLALHRLWGTLTWIDEYIAEMKDPELRNAATTYAKNSLGRAREEVQNLAGMLGVEFDDSNLWQPFGGAWPDDTAR
jgi:hypothetical protein